MCGITGWVDWEVDLRNQKDVFSKMGKTLHNRGPDANGTWLTKSAGFAHTRLIVIDPAGGQQPMIKQYGERKYVIVYNGELYNTAELRKELENRGHMFVSNCDTEVVLVAYIEWGESCVERFNGIYAIGIWDDEKQQLFLARDRLGVKPLFYSRQKNSLIFGSELKALLAHPYLKPELDENGIAEVFGLGPSRTPGNGVFKNISEVRPGFSIIYNREGLKTRQYWKLTSYPHEESLPTTITKVKELVIDAIERQLISDVPVCTFLSGGLDSSIISTVAANLYRQNGEILNTYSIDYVGNQENFRASEFQPNADAPSIKLMSKFINSQHHNILVDTEQLVSALEDAVLARDLPGMADVDSSLLLFSREIKKGATVGLSGECADEIFGGYPWFYREQDLNSKTFPWLRSLSEREKLLSKEIREKVGITNYVEERYRQTLTEVPRLSGESIEQNRMRELFYLNMTWFMATLLERKDRMTMATGLEVRVPYADHRIVEYLWNIPWEMKNLDNREKGILREAVKGILPEEIGKRRKSPYPKTHNPAYTKAVSTKLLSVLEDSTSPILQLLDKETAVQIAKTGGESFKVPWFGQLMTGPQLLAYLLQVNFWLKEYKITIK